MMKKKTQQQNDIDLFSSHFHGNGGKIIFMLYIAFHFEFSTNLG